MCYFYFLKLAFFLVCLVFAERRHNFDFGIRQETDRRWFRMYKARKQRSLWVSLSVSDEFTCCVRRENRVWVGISVSVFLTDLLKGSVDPFLQSEPTFNGGRLCFRILLLGNGFFIIIIIIFSLPQGCVLGKAQANTDALCDEEDE